MVHVCNIGGCTRSYMYRKGLLRHQKSHNMPARFNCQHCNLPFNRQQEFYLHQLRCGGNLRPRTPSPPPSPKRNNRPTKNVKGFQSLEKAPHSKTQTWHTGSNMKKETQQLNWGKTWKNLSNTWKKIEFLSSKEQNRHKIQHVIIPSLRTKRRW